jgi:leucyl/phenylalanyl-tRNA--protein transferase
MKSAIYQGNTASSFPPVEQAQDDGLLAMGGDLSPDRLIDAYRHGVFPWFNEDDPILWWSPDPRMVLFTHEITRSKSLRKTLRTTSLTVSFDTAFIDVITACSGPRPQYDSNETWIHRNMIEAYNSLHELGYAHSVEVWDNDTLVGGLYGVAIGHVFFGESMFSHVKDSSKIALVSLCQQLQRWNFPLIDCQIYSEHLASMGAKTIARSDFTDYLNTFCERSTSLMTPHWTIDKDLPNVL